MLELWDAEHKSCPKRCSCHISSLPVDNMSKRLKTGHTLVPELEFYSSWLAWNQQCYKLCKIAITPWCKSYPGMKWQWWSRGVNITSNLSWTSHIESMAKKAHQGFYLLRRFRKYGMPPTTLTNFYWCTVKNILSGCTIAWFGNNPFQDCLKLHRIMDITQIITDQPPFYRFHLHFTLPLQGH